MPYESTKELPDSVRDNLPSHAQEIYMSAYNSAWEQYKDPDSRDDPSDSREEVAARVAWNAVKQNYEKQGERWVKKN